MSQSAEHALTHFDKDGRARMVDISGKEATQRTAVALARLRMDVTTASAIRDGRIGKGDVLAVAQVAAVMAAKRTSDMIPMCHPLPLSSVSTSFNLDVENGQLDIRVTVSTVWSTGVEMEALTAASVAALTVYDMCKSIDRSMYVTTVCLMEKHGGKSGSYIRPDET